MSRSIRWFPTAGVKRFNFPLLCLAAAAALPAIARASLTVSLQLAPGAAGAADTTDYIDPSKAGADIPIYVYATVTGQNPITPVPTPGGSSSAPQTTNGNFDGLQFVYYNVNNTTSNGGNGLIDNASGYAPTLNTLGSTGFASYGSHAGLVQNVANGISVGSTNTSNPASGVVFAASGSAVFDNYYTFSAATQTYTEYGNDAAGDIYLSNNNKSASFLVETLYFKPSFTASSFTASTASARVSTTFAISPVGYSGEAGPDANWFQDQAAEPATGSAPTSTMNGSYAAGTSVSFVNTLAGDANDDGTVNLSDFNALAENFGDTNATWAQGDFTGDGVVNLNDFNVLAENFGQTLAGGSSNSALTADPALMAFAQAQGDTAYLDAISVPEPASGAVMLLCGEALWTRRRAAASRR